MDNSYEKFINCYSNFLRQPRFIIIIFSIFRKMRNLCVIIILKILCISLLLISIQQMRAKFAGSLAVYLLYFVRFCFWNRWLLPVATTFYTRKIHFRSCLFCVAYNCQECWQSVLAAVLFLKHFGFSSDLLKYKEKTKN